MKLADGEGDKSEAKEEDQITARGKAKFNQMGMLERQVPSEDGDATFQ